MGKKRYRKSYRSKGERSNVANMKPHWDIIDRAIFKARAILKKKRVYDTIPNPDKTKTNARFIRVLVNG